MTIENKTKNIPYDIKKDPNAKELVTWLLKDKEKTKDYTNSSLTKTVK